MPGSPEAAAAMQLARRIKRWCGPAAYDEWKRSGNLPDDLPTAEELRELTKAAAKKAAKDRYESDLESARANGRERSARHREKIGVEAQRQSRRDSYHRDIDLSMFAALFPRQVNVSVIAVSA